MRLIINVTLIALLFIVAACSNNSKSEYSIPPMVVEIPDELKDKPEVVAFIRSSEKTINRFAETIERSYIENPKLWQKEAEDLSMVEKLKALKVAGEMAVAFGEFSMNYANMHDRMEHFEREMTDDQVLAMAAVGEAFEKRMKLLEQRLEKMGAN